MEVLRSLIFTGAQQRGLPLMGVRSAPAGDVQCFGGDCYALAFGVPATLMVIALGKCFTLPVSSDAKAHFLELFVRSIWV